MRSGYAISAPRRTLSDLENEMNSLSISERELLHKEMYGFITETIIETDDRIQTALYEMDQLLQNMILDPTIYNIDTRTIQSYVRAYETVPDFVTDPKLRIQFIRCDLFKIKDAAIRFVKYWKERIWLWGEDKAFRKITIQDFDDDDMVALNGGGHQVCPAFDQFQRGIIICDRNKFDNRPTHRKSQLRQLWYVHEAAIENEYIQKNGIVSIPGLGLRRSSLLEQDRKFDYLAVQIMTYAFPIRIVSIHHIVSNKMLQYAVPFLLYVLGSQLRKRYKCHIYSGKIFDVLQQYGIPRESLPQECGGSHPTYNYADWLESRRQQNL